MTKRRSFSPEFKAQVVLDMLTEGKSLADASREYGLKDSVLSRWRQELMQRAPQLFAPDGNQAASEQRIAELERLVGRLPLELAMGKKLPNHLHSTLPRNES